MSAAPGDGHVASFVQGRALANGALVEVGESAATLEASRFGLETLATLDVTDADAVRRAAGDLVRACRRPSGGFAMKAEDADADLAGTYYAMRLIATGLIDVEPEPKTMEEWLRAAVLTADGEISVDVDELYYALRALVLGGIELPAPAEEAVRRFVGSCESAAGGFADLPGAAPDIERTYCCLHMLQLLGDERVEAAHAEFILASADDERIYWDPARERCSPATMYWGSRAAEIGGVPLSWAGIEGGIEAFRHPDGGYGLDGEASLWLTYCGARTAALARQARSQVTR